MFLIFVLIVALLAVPEQTLDALEAGSEKGRIGLINLRMLLVALYEHKKNGGSIKDFSFIPTWKQDGNDSERN